MFAVSRQRSPYVLSHLQTCQLWADSHYEMKGGRLLLARLRSCRRTTKSIDSGVNGQLSVGFVMVQMGAVTASGPCIMHTVAVCSCNTVCETLESAGQHRHCGGGWTPQLPWQHQLVGALQCCYFLLQCCYVEWQYTLEESLSKSLS